MAGTDAPAPVAAQGLRFREMRPEDAQAALALSDEAGWNQTVEDWRFMLSQGPALGLQEPGGSWVGSSLVVPLGPAVSWISMVLVSRPYRRRGLGTVLLDRCIAAVQASGAAPGLDATEFGRPVYIPRGFCDLYQISRWRMDTKAMAGSVPAGCRVHRLTEADLESVSAFDRSRSHTERGATLAYLLRRAPGHAWFAEAGGTLAGYALGRPGRRSAQVGPVLADNAPVALALIGRMMALGPSVILDVPDVHGAVADSLWHHGAVRLRGFTRMTLGEVPGLRDPRFIFALAGPELS